jgi:DNA-binding MarR family transcriptional regulator
MSTQQTRGTGAAGEIEHVVDGYSRLLHLVTPTRSAGIFESSVTMAQLKVLMVLGSIDESRMSELASNLRLTLSTVSGLVERLVENGLVARRTHESDRRQVMVSLTDDGRGFLESFQELGMQTLRELLEQLSAEELAQVGQAVELLISAAQRTMNKENE